jgi:hypothetical protein
VADQHHYAHVIRLPESLSSGNRRDHSGPLDRIGPRVPSVQHPDQ